MNSSIDFIDPLMKSGQRARHLAGAMIRRSILHQVISGLSNENRCLDKARRPVVEFSLKSEENPLHPISFRINSQSRGRGLLCMLFIIYSFILTAAFLGALLQSLCICI